MSADNIPHGTYSGSKHFRCRCDDCAQARREYQNHANRQKAYGTWDPYGDLQAVVAHLCYLLETGWSMKQIAVEAGRSTTTLRKLVNGQREKVLATTADRVLAVVGPPAGDHPVVALRSARGAERRVRALLALGWTCPQISELSGVSLSAVNDLRRGISSGVSSVTHDRIVRVYGDLSMRAPDVPSALKIREAAREGWPPPAGWDDHWLDLSDEELAAELGREVARMDDAEVRRNYRAVHDDGELSPLSVAAAQEHNRRRTASGQVQGVAA